MLDKGREPLRQKWGPFARTQGRLHELYYGRSQRAVRFRIGVLAIDFVVIAFFIAAPLLRDDALSFLFLDYVLAVVVALDIAARAVAWNDFRDWIRKPTTWIDLFVLATLLFPYWLLNFGFLRVLRLWTLVNSDFFWRTVGHRFDNTRWEDIFKASTALLTFVFVATGFVYTSFAGTHPGIAGYVDALYFTVATLTTTGFGDITLPGIWGRLISIVIMVTGLTLFVRLAQPIFRPYKVQFLCPTCGLSRHDPDAVHCKACGELLNIPNDEE
jgi:voltage-gated potassium channel